MSCLALGNSSRGGVYLGPDAPHVEAGLNFKGASLWLKGYVDDGANSGYFYVSAIYLNPYNVLFAQHAKYAGGLSISFISIGTGNNFNTNPGTVANIQNISYYEGYVNDGNGTTPDLAIAHLTTPLPLPTCPGVNALGGPVSLNPITFASVSQDETIWGTGFGVWGNPENRQLPDGNIRAWTAPVDTYGQGFSDEYYFTADFSPGGALGPMNGRMSQLDSGGGWYNAQGQLVGMGIAYNTGYTIVEKLANPEIQNWIQAHLFVPPTLNIQRNATNAVLSWTGNYKLQSSTNLSCCFADVSGATSPYTNAMTVPQQFFRLASTNAP